LYEILIHFIIQFTYFLALLNTFLILLLIFRNTISFFINPFFILRIILFLQLLYLFCLNLFLIDNFLFLVYQIFPIFLLINQIPLYLHQLGQLVFLCILVHKTSSFLDLFFLFFFWVNVKISPDVLRIVVVSWVFQIDSDCGFFF